MYEAYIYIYQYMNIHILYGYMNISYEYMNYIFILYEYTI